MAQIKDNPPWINKVQNYLRLQLPLKWWFSALTACLGTLAGLLGSIYGTNIQNAFPFNWGSGPIVSQVVLFWISLIIFGCFFGLGFGAQNEATNKLEQMMRTLPPKGFLVTFETLFSNCFKVYWNASEAQNKPELVLAITTSLKGVLFLLKAFDTRHDHPQYSANIMLFKPIHEVSADSLKHVLFKEPGYDFNAWDGVLELQSEYAFSLIDDAPTPDKIPTIMLPVPKEEFRFDKGKPTVLPGAPAAFCDPTKSVGFENTLQLSTWCRQHSGLRESVAEEVEKYFVDGPGKEIRSFISIPILLPSTVPDATPTILGVLNLHSNRDRILPGEKAGLFVPLTAPFTSLIARSLQKYGSLP